MQLAERQHAWHHLQTCLDDRHSPCPSCALAFPSYAADRIAQEVMTLIDAYSELPFFAGRSTSFRVPFQRWFLLDRLRVALLFVASQRVAASKVSEHKVMN